MAGSAATDAARVLTIGSPAKGWVLPLDAAPDPAFSSGALGEGVLVELLDGTITAPCDARVAAIATTQHAITLETNGGAQILIHCGIDTVALQGAPFEILVEEGASVTAGQSLMHADLEAIARAGKSLATPVVLVEPAGHSLDFDQPLSRLVACGEEILSLVIGSADPAAPVQTEEFTTSREVTLPLPHGLHARPAAAIAAEAARWSGPLAIALGDRRANARSTTALMKLGATHGALLTIHAGGEDAQASLDALSRLIVSGAGDAIDHPTPANRNDAPLVKLRRRELQSPGLPAGMIAGVAAAPGEALGEAYYLHRARLEVSEKSQGTVVEKSRLSEALQKLRKHLDRDAGGEAKVIAAAHRAILDDPALLEAVHQEIESGGSAAVAWQHVMGEEANSLRALPDPRLAERADDFADLEQQLLRILSGKDAELSAPSGSIVIANDLYPSDLAPLAKAGIAGIATMAGGPTSHLAILAASAGIPMAVAFGKPLCEVEEGAKIHLDGSSGRIRHALSETDCHDIAQAIERSALLHQQALQSAGEDTYLSSGERIEVFANLGSVADAKEAVKLGAEGSGLLRTEFLFLDRSSPPGEAEQADIYRAIMNTFHSSPVIIRTLDIGADKPAPYLPLDAEDNPALGVRGIRIGLRYPELLESQIRAILKAADGRTAHIMAPMVASLDEFDQLRNALDAIKRETGHKSPVKLGAMIETPASALIASELAKKADFLSVGTNDLTQYTLAVDRTNPDLAAMLDPMHPAVLRLIEIAGNACNANDCMLGVCGSAAGDHVAAAVLVGLGVGELSASAARIPELKQHLRSLTLDQCHRAAEAALGANSAAAARAAVAEVLAQTGEE